MLKPAQLYKEELENLFLKTWYDPKSLNQVLGGNQI